MSKRIFSRNKTHKKTDKTPSPKKESPVKPPSPKNESIKPPSPKKDSPVKPPSPKNIIQEQIDTYNTANPDYLFTLGPNKKINITSQKQSEKSESSLCAEIIIKSESHIYLKELNKCTGFSGTEVLHVVEDFAKTNGYTKIELEDAAEIVGTPGIRSQGGRCMIMLAFFNILATGETWYNKHGYISKFTEQEKTHNAKIIQKPFIQYIKDIQTRAELEDSYVKPILDGMKYYVKTKKAQNAITIKELFTKIKEDMKSEKLDCNDNNKKHNWVVDVSRFSLDFGASVYNIKRATADNIVYVRTNQIKTL
jgi:hypothetical protein